MSNNRKYRQYQLRTKDSCALERIFSNKAVYRLQNFNINTKKIY